MKRLIKSARVVDPQSPHNGKVCDILLSDGKIEEIDAQLNGDGETFTAENLHVSPGWFDMRVNFYDPGFEHREDICTGLQAARRGGFTGVGLVPSTDPPLSTKAQIDYVRNRARGAVVELLPYGTISAQRDGAQLAELYDLSRAGAVAFTDDKAPLAHAALMSTALLYAKNFNGLIMSFPHEPSLCEGGQMHEGAMSTSLGLKGLPALAEEVMVARDLYLAEYNDCPIHFTGISTSGSVALIRAAKSKGLRVTCDVYVHNLLLTDDELAGFDQNKKVLPPLRSANHRDALIAGLKDGTIDAICSDHTPEDTERKKTEFEHAAFGMIGLETLFGVLQEAAGSDLALETVIDKIAIAPRRILNQPIPTLKAGAEVNLTLFNPEETWTFAREEIRSKSANSPFIGKDFAGKPLAVARGAQFESC